MKYNYKISEQKYFLEDIKIVVIEDKPWLNHILD
jgi:hypothetical protein